MDKRFAANTYESDFDSDHGKAAKRAKYHDLNDRRKSVGTKLPEKSEVFAEYNKSEGRIHRQEFISLDAYSRHKMLINHYLVFQGRSMKDFKRDTSNDRTDMDVIHENHQFLWDDEESDGTWEKKMAKKYYDKLFKEYCIGDLSRYKENKIALRWRIEKEVVEGKGQFICGNKKCKENEALKSWEVNFGYIENGEKKNALVKIRLCIDCSYKLNYHHKKREVKRKKKADKESAKQGAPSSESTFTDTTTSTTTGPTSSTSTTSTEDTNSTSAAAGSEKGDKDGETSHWSGPAPKLDEKSREEEYEDYFEDMFL